MTKEHRIETLKELLLNSKDPVSGNVLAEKLNVSRQVIVQYISLIKAEGYNVISTNKGYLLKEETFEASFKVKHDDGEITDELYLFVDNGAYIKNIYIMHPNYGMIKADLNISSRLDVDNFCKSLENTSDEPLKLMTEGVHYHTVVVKDKAIIPLLEKKLKEKHFHID